MFWKKKKPKKPTRKDIIEQATQSMREKREEIGDETLASIREAISKRENSALGKAKSCLLYTSPSPRDGLLSRMPSSA